jgi:imidazolonepropionase-like amidohydrolase
VSSATIFRNVRIFDGKTDSLSVASDVLVTGSTIERIGAGSLTVDESTAVIEGAGRTLMPGLIDAHWHAALAVIPVPALMMADIGYIQIVAAREAGNTLMRGFTTVRDVGGPVFGLKRAIDEGVTAGPRIWPSGPIISQTGGHGDFRFPGDVPAPRCAALHHSEQVGAAAIADGPDEVRKRVRESLMLGASQIKLAAGGGVASSYDPLDVAQYTEAEFRAAVEAADNWGTYVTVHAYTPKAIRAAIAGGVRCIEHGHLVDEATVKLIADEGIWLCLQPFLDDEDAIPNPPQNRKKQLQLFAGTDTAYELAKKYKVKTAWGTDTLFDAHLATRQGAQLAKMVRWYTPAEVLRMATSVNAEVLTLSGNRCPYEGRLGVVEESALADLLLVDGDPLANIELLADTQKLLVIMKDGKIYKNEAKP